MKYKYFLFAIQCNRNYSNFIKNFDLGIEEIGVQVEISFITDKEPTKKMTTKIEKLLESSKDEKSLTCYFRCVKFIRAEVINE